MRRLLSKGRNSIMRSTGFIAALLMTRPQAGLAAAMGKKTTKTV